MNFVRLSFIVITFSLLFVGKTLAQTANNPTAVEFQSPDHSDPAVTGYELDLKACTSPTTCTNVIQTITISKANVTLVTGTNPQVYRATINVQPITFGSYVGVMRTVAGTIKSSDSAPSDTFNRVPGAPSKPAFK